jgi:hypothetical protein
MLKYHLQRALGEVRNPCQDKRSKQGVLAVRS